MHDGTRGFEQAAWRIHFDEHGVRMDLTCAGKAALEILFADGLDGIVQP
jgi:hypothetical protein